MFDRILKTPLIFWVNLIRTKNLFQLSFSANITDQKYQDLNSVLVKGKKTNDGNNYIKNCKLHFKMIS